MSDSILPIGYTSVPSPTTTRRTSYQSSTTGPSDRQSDSVQFSQAAQFLSKLSDLPAVRQPLIDRVKSEIAAGSYDSPDKVDSLLNSLANDLGFSTDNSQA